MTMVSATSDIRIKGMAKYQSPLTNCQNAVMASSPAFQIVELALEKEVNSGYAS
jgi:hypothetical protein